MPKPSPTFAGLVVYADSALAPLSLRISQRPRSRPKRIVLTEAEIDAILAVAGDCDAPATIDSCYEEHEREAVAAALESGMNKLRRMFFAKQAARTRRHRA